MSQRSETITSETIISLNIVINSYVGPPLDQQDENNSKQSSLGWMRIVMEKAIKCMYLYFILYILIIL